jgi:hypothetical protein
MLYTRRPALALVASAVAGAGSGRASGGTAGRSASSAPRGRQPDLLTRDEIARAQWPTAYDMVLALRPRWLSTRGADTIMGQQGEVRVRVDDAPAGGASALRTLMPSVVASLRFVAPAAAAGRPGSSHVHGASLVATVDR